MPKTTPRPAFQLGRHKIAAGERKTVNLPVSVLSDHTPVTMSAHVVHGKRPGPVIFVSGGVHGDEVIGVEIVRRLLRATNLNALRGTLIAIPIVNTYGFLNHSRYLPDRRDLNRVFPGSATGSLAGRLADLFTNEIVAKSDLGIDLHSAAIHRTNYPQVRISPDNPRTEELAKVFGAPIVMRSPLREGSLRQTAQDLGKDVLLYESGEGLRFDELSVRAGLAGILRVMRHLDMISSKGVSKPKAAPQFCPSSKWLRAPMGGLLRLYKADGELVREGDLMATVSDPFGEQEKDIRAPFDGIVVGRAVMPIVNEGDALFHLGRVASVVRAENAVEGLNAQLGDDPMFDEDEII
ncbi:succinylglutamate desuccinylase/aspartoacylase family protein [Pseudoprimorskyibacter insulae]|uniref:N-alpha-acetyl-L-2,4-diaminobutyric acid deacetylase n=1 Tax=Pseudoprimorskyibacter insulae TaxID=1695997 RepID=A0A2R8B0N4_9RHOB|nr:succinylglutamate desuccinylase/aspartoacylase family protein [Pseudoprimorskyibacter insulae]SPF81669.1 N-alpha-acetyl-L-2,4-diaminobutyric acid deacetylase [Pseudoprimorskyibacter insulae]